MYIYIYLIFVWHVYRTRIFNRLRFFRKVNFWKKIWCTQLEFILGAGMFCDAIGKVKLTCPIKSGSYPTSTISRWQPVALVCVADVQYRVMLVCWRFAEIAELVYRKKCLFSVSVGWQRRINAIGYSDFVNCVQRRVDKVYRQTNNRAIDVCY